MSRPPNKRGDFHDQLLGFIADPRNLKAAWNHLKRKDSQGAGPDGHTFADYTRQQAWELICELSKLLLDGKYRHGPFRRARIPKHPGSSKKREIWIANVVDRVVSRAAAQILAPLFESMYSDMIFCRRGRGRLLAIATAKVRSEQGNVETWITQDLTNAFPSVPKKRLMDVVRKFVGNDEVNSLVADLIDKEGRNGIPAGSPITSVLLTLYVHHAIYRPWMARHPDVPLLTYLDDFLLLPGPAENIDGLGRDLEQIVNTAGFQLKYSASEATNRLRSGEASWLGYKVSKDDGDIRIRVAWADDPTACEKRYHGRLIQFHSHPDAVLLAPKVIDQIIAQAAPAFPNTDVDAAIWSLLAVAKRAGFVEMPSVSSIREHWTAHHMRWCYLLESLTDKTLPPALLNDPRARTLVIHTDGCCLGRSGVGGWAFRIHESGKPVESKRGGLAKTTSNRAELIAVIRALELLSEPCQVQFVTDSQYVARGLRRLQERRDAGWRSQTGRRYRALRNVDLWCRLYEASIRHQIVAKWIRGHSGNPENEWCDRHAKAAARKHRSKT
jgi:ribonuclease HI